MKLELSSEEVQQAVADYLAKRGVPMEAPTLRVVTRDKATVIVAEGEVKTAPRGLQPPAPSR